MLQNPPNWLSSNAIHTFQTFWRARHFFNFTFDGQKSEIKIPKILIFFWKKRKNFLNWRPRVWISREILKNGFIKEKNVWTIQLTSNILVLEFSFEFSIKMKYWYCPKRRQIQKFQKWLDWLLREYWSHFKAKNRVFQRRLNEILETART